MKQIIYYWPKSGSDPTAGKTGVDPEGMAGERAGVEKEVQGTEAESIEVIGN